MMLVIVQSHPAIMEYLLTVGTHALALHKPLNPNHSGLWGLARAARQEVPTVQLKCLAVYNAASWPTLLESTPSEEVEVGSKAAGAAQLAPRLRATRDWQQGNVQLGFQKRGALSNLSISPQLANELACAADEAELRVHAWASTSATCSMSWAVSRRPGPPGGDHWRGGSSGCEGGPHLSRRRSFGFASGSLASLARTR